MKVLIVDDDPGLRATLGDILNVKGIEAVIAKTGGAALAQAEQKDIDVAVIDLRLEDISGLEVLRGIRQRSPDTECILLTGHATQDSAIEAVNLGAYSYYQKPFDMDQLLLSIRRAGEKRAAGRALTESEERYHRLVDNASEAILVAQDGMLKFVNRMAIDLTGYSEQELTSRPFPEFVHPEDRGMVVERYQRRIKGDASQLKYAFRLMVRDGSIKWAEIGAVLIDWEGRPATLNFLNDITERKRAEETQRASERRYQTLAEVSPAGIFRTDADGLTTYVNRRWCEISGISAEAALGNGWLEAVHPDDRAKLTEGWQAAVEDRAGSASDYRFLNPDGNITWVIGQAVPEEDEQGRIVGYIGAITDITERKRAEQEILRRVTELEVLYENGIAISRILEPHEIGEKIIEIFNRKLNWHHAAIRLFDPRRNRMMMLAFNHPGLSEEERLAHIEKLRKRAGEPGKGISGWVIQHGESVLCMDVRQDERYVRTYPGIRSGLYVPLKAGQQVIGSIAIESTRVEAFNEQDLRLLETVAAQAAGALENARLYQDTVRAAERRAILYHASQEIATAGLDLEQVYRSIHQAAAQLMPLDLFAIVLADKNEKALHAVYLIDRGERYPAFDSAWGSGLAGHVIREKKSLRIADYQKQKPAKAVWFGGPGVPRSIIAVPLHSGAQIVGVLSVQDYHPDIYDEEDEILLKTLAAYAGTAIENSRLFEATRRHAEQLAAVNKIGHVLAETLELNLVYNQLADFINELLPDTCALFISLYNAPAKTITCAFARADGAVVNVKELPPLPFDPGGKGRQSRVLISREPLIATNLAATLGKKPSTTLVGDSDRKPDSAMYVPMLSKGAPIGLIQVQSYTPNRFSPEDINLLALVANTAAVIIENARLFTETQSRLRFLSALHTIDTAISASVDLRITLNIILENVTGELRVDAAAVALLNPYTRILEYTASRGFRSRIVEGMRIKLGEGLAGQAAIQRRILNLSEAGPMDGKNVPGVDIFADEQFASQFAIPLTAKGQVQGVLQICHRTEMNPGQDWFDFLDTLAGQAAIALDNARMFDNLQRSNLDLLLAYDATIQGWSQALDMRDRETEGHTQRVADMAMTLAGAMGMNEAELEHIRRGALLHDIGKIGVPDAILHKPGPLTDEEWVIMRTHPVKAYEMLSPIDYLRPALDIPYCHHEKWDGSGYPRGLKGESIPLAARIFAVVDVFDALTSDRPYRPAWSKSKALKHIKQETGKHFEPKVAEVFLKMLKQ
jgi:PAS domain S-box-containing protein/putative nucleotidyltransferase with HDIG domain